MKKSWSFVLFVGLILIMSFSLVSANIFSDFWNWINGGGNNEIGLSPSGVDAYCSQVGGYDVFTEEKVSDGYGISDADLVKCFPKLDGGDFANYNDALSSGCGDYVCALYRGVADGVLVSSIVDKKCSKSEGWPLSGVSISCATWCPSNLNQVWDSSQGKCVTESETPVCGNLFLK